MRAIAHIVRWILDNDVDLVYYGSLLLLFLLTFLALLRYLAA